MPTIKINKNKTNLHLISINYKWVLKIEVKTRITMGNNSEMHILVIIID